MAHGMHGGLLDWSSGVIFCKQLSWNVWPQLRTATGGEIGGCSTGPSGENIRSLLHIKHLSPVGSGCSSMRVKPSSGQC